MAKGDTFDVTEGDEIEVSFQLSLKRAEIAKRRDAAQLTHVVINFTPATPSDPTLGGSITFAPLSPDAQNDPTFGQVIPITQDDPKVTRLFRVGFIQMLLGQAPPAQFIVNVSAKLTPNVGESQATSSQPRDGDLCTLRVKPLRRAGR